MRKQKQFRLVIGSGSHNLAEASGTVWKLLLVDSLNSGRVRAADVIRLVGVANTEC